MYVAEMSWPDYRDRVRDHLVVLPVGAVEAHGRHLPLSTDTIIASYLAARVAQETEALVLPAVPYGVKTDPVRSGGEFPGMTNLRAVTLTNLVLDVLTASYRHGARRFLVLHGHIANLPIVFESIDMFVASCAEARVMAASWWDFASEETRDEIARETGVARDVDHHAAMVETSLMMHVAENMVDADAIIDDASQRRIRYLVMPPPADVLTTAGVIYQATRASAKIGARLIPEIVDNLVDAVRLELS